MRFKLFTALATVALVPAMALLASTPAYAAPAPPAGQRITHCSQEITGTNAYLAHDLRCSKGFTVGATLHILDMQGHRLQGDGRGTAFTVKGIEVPPGQPQQYAQLDISNGRIDHWETAFSLVTASVDATKLTVDHNTTGFLAGLDGHVFVGKSVLDNNVVAMRAGYLGLIRVETTKFSHNGAGILATSRMRLVNGTDPDVAVFRSQFVKNLVGVYGGLTNGRPGDFDVVVQTSTFTENGDAVHLTGADRASIAALDNNTAYENGRDGFYATGAYDNINNNTAYKNGRYGFYLVSTDIYTFGNRAWENGRPCVGVVCNPS